MSLQNCYNFSDFRDLAKKKLPKMFYDYIDTGSYTGRTYIDNEEDFKKIHKLR